MTNLDKLCQTPIKLAMALIKTVDTPTYVQTPDADVLGYCVPAYKTSDGKVFPTYNEALTHECEWLKAPAEGMKKVRVSAKAKCIETDDN